MKKRDYVLVILLLTTIFNVFLFLINSSFAIEEEYHTRTDLLNYTTNKEDLYTNLYNFINTNDNLLISLSSFEMSPILNENYDYMVRFAQNYIVDNLEEYQDKINNNYINVSEIYTITDNFFGKSKFYIENIIDDKILLTPDNRRFEMSIKNLNILSIEDNQVKVDVEYKNEYTTLNYQYVFEIQNDKLIIKNIEVLE